MIKPSSLLQSRFNSSQSFNDVWFGPDPEILSAQGLVILGLLTKMILSSFFEDWCAKHASMSRVLCSRVSGSTVSYVGRSVMCCCTWR